MADWVVDRPETPEKFRRKEKRHDQNPRHQRSHPVSDGSQRNKTEKKRAGKGIVIVIGAIAVMAFVVYLTAITIATTQS